MSPSRFSLGFIAFVLVACANDDDSVMSSSAPEPEPEPSSVPITEQSKPIAVAQSIITTQDVAVDIVLVGTTNIGTIINYSIEDQVANGTVVGSPPNISYIPDSGFVGVDGFTFSVSSVQGVSDPAAVTISVNPLPNSEPLAEPQSITVLLNTPQDIVLSGFDTDGTIEQYVVLSNPGKGVLSGNEPQLVYTPNLDEFGNDSFTFSVTDDKGANSLAAVVEIEINSLLSTLQGRSDGKGVDLVITGDAFTVDQLETFHNAVDDYVDFMFTYNTVMQNQRSGWNIHRLDTVSLTANLNDTINTAFEAYYNCNGIQRLICVNTTAVVTAVSAAFPQYDHILVLVNNAEYGGSGGFLSVASLHTDASHVALHEMGHSFAGLADEYTSPAYPPPQIEPIEPNVTLNNDPLSVKWMHWLGGDHPEIGLFEGARYAETGVWRPTFNSFMRSLRQPFYAINQEAWSLALYHSTGTYYGKTPAIPDVSHTVGDQLVFSVELSIGTQSQQLDWYVDGVLMQNNNAVTFVCCNDKMSDYSVSARIMDSTTTIRWDVSEVSSSVVTWNVTAQQ